MAFKPNYGFERRQRAKSKAEKKAAKRAERAARRAARGGEGEESDLTRDEGADELPSLADEDAGPDGK